MPSMKMSLPRLALLVLLLPIAATQAIAAPAGALDLTAYRGKVVLVDFWASWCTPCARSFPWMAELLEKHGPDGLAIVAVNLDENPEDAARFLDGRRAPFDHVSDPAGDLARAFGVEAMPTAFLFDREGRPAFVHSGFHAEEQAVYEERVVALLEGRAAPDPALIARLGAGGRSDGGLGVDPWERGALARGDMRLDCDPMELATDDHIYFSKEASSGGRGFGGGGCGCN